MIRSNFDTAEQIATKMGDASNSIQNATNKTIVKAEQTTLKVNKKALEANEQAVNLAQLFNVAFLQTIQDIHSVAKEFERTDIDLQNNFNQWPANDYFGDWMTYEKARNGWK